MYTSGTTGRPKGCVISTATSCARWTPSSGAGSRCSTPSAATRRPRCCS
ncbi:long-chain fatty acid--CoA ligase [Streptomyces tricolor]|nr:long-chain fatty acid--CoA ligase [Streptomyces tricolor]